MIREANLNDIPRIVELELSVFSHTLGENMLYTEITSNPFSTILVLENEIKVIGYIGYRCVDDYAELMNFCIDKEYQSLGFGKELFNNALIRIKNEKCKFLTLEVRISNKRARGFYESFGFKLSHIRKDYYVSEDGCVYIKEL